MYVGDYWTVCSLFRGVDYSVTRWEAPGGIGSSSGGWPTILLQYFDVVGWVSDLQNCLPDDLYCVGGDVKPYLLTNQTTSEHQHGFIT